MSEEDNYTLIINLSNLYLTYLTGEEGGIMTDQEIEQKINTYPYKLSPEEKEKRRKEMQKSSYENKIELESYQKDYPIQTYTGTHADILNKFITFFVKNYDNYDDNYDETLNCESWEGFSNFEYFHIYYNHTLSQLEICERCSYEYPFIQIICHSKNKTEYKFEAFQVKFSNIYTEHAETHDIYYEKMFKIREFEKKEFYWKRERLALKKEVAKLRAQLVHEGLAKAAMHPNKIAKLLEDDEDTDLDSKI
jgi:hypothetical protein